MALSDFIEIVTAGLDPARLLRDSNAEVVQMLEGDFELRNAVVGLLYLYGERQQAATMLIQYGMLWDAEILLRSGAEAALKVPFLCLADPAQRTRRLTEFSEILPATADLRQSERARRRLDILLPDAPDRLIFEELVLSEEQEERIQRTWPRKVRQRANAKWSFTEMLHWVDDTMEAAGQPGVLKSLLHGYGLSSHLIHSDQRALDLVFDRKQRDPSVRDAMRLAHAARLCQDFLACGLAAGFALRAHVNAPPSEAWAQAVPAYWAFCESTQPLFDDFYSAITMAEVDPGAET